jgi:predicted RNase H-like nuclease
VPIGLPDAGNRHADDAAKAALGARACTVFRTVLRPVASAATSHQNAVALTRALTGRGISIQAWSCVKKIVEFDRVMMPVDQLRVFEIHPELSFAAWAGSPIMSSKKSIGGRNDRRKLVDAWLGAAAFPAIRGMFSRSAVGDDDILDSIAALWSSRRIARGVADRLPGGITQVDSRGLVMDMWR